MSDDVKRPIWPGLHACYDGHGGISVDVDDRQLGYIRLSRYRRIEDESKFIEAVNSIAKLTAERDALKAACETLLACDRETDPGTGLALLQQAVEQARAALKLCEVQQ